MTHTARLLASALVSLFAFASSPPALAQACASRGALDARYCDDNGDLIADQPKDPKAWQNPSTLVFSYTPVEDPAVYENVFADFLAHLSKVTGKRVRWYPAESYAAQVEAMRCLAYEAAAGLDLAKRLADPDARKLAQRRVDLLIPIVKAWSTDVGQEVYTVARELFDALRLQRARIRLVGVRLEGLIEESARTEQLLFDAPGSDTPADRRAAEVAADRLRDRFGDDVVRPARLWSDPE